MLHRPPESNGDGLLPEYNLCMARGWESKSIEEQQSQASSSQQLGPRPTLDQLARLHQQQGLLLSRARVIQQLETAQNAQHREMLKAALVELDARLARLG
jgi:hypothetical protein